MAELRVLSNWGHLEYTCVYRFRVHGEPSLWKIIHSWFTLCKKKAQMHWTLRERIRQLPNVQIPKKRTRSTDIRMKIVRPLNKYSVCIPPTFIFRQVLIGDFSFLVIYLFILCKRARLKWIVHPKIKIHSSSSCSKPLRFWKKWKENTMRINSQYIFIKMYCSTEERNLEQLE